MTRETKIGLVVACSFLCLVGVVIASKMNGGGDPAPVTEFADASKKNGGGPSPLAKDPEESEAKGKHTGEKHPQMAPAPTQPNGPVPPANAMPAIGKAAEPEKKGGAGNGDKGLQHQKGMEAVAPVPVPAPPPGNTDLIVAAPPGSKTTGDISGSPTPAAIGSDLPMAPLPPPIVPGAVDPAVVPPVPLPPPLPPQGSDRIPMKSAEPIAPLPVPADKAVGQNGPMPIPAAVNPPLKDSFQVNKDAQTPTLPMPPSNNTQLPSGPPALPAPLPSIGQPPSGPPAISPAPPSIGQPPSGPPAISPAPLSIGQPPSGSPAISPAPPSIAQPPSGPPAISPAPPSIGQPPSGPPALPTPPLNVGTPPSGPPTFPPPSIGQPPSDPPTFPMPPSNFGSPPSPPPPYSGTPPGPNPIIPSAQLPNGPPIEVATQSPASPIPTLPAAGAVPLPKVVTTRTDFVKVLPGETNFAQLSKRLYNDERYAAALQAYNRAHWDAIPDPALNAAQPILTANQQVLRPPVNVLEIKYGSLIRTSAPSPVVPVIGTTTVPRPTPVVPSSAPVPTTPGVYIVQAAAGERIRDIALRLLGSAERWDEIYNLNRNIQPQFAIPQGTQLKLP